MKRRGLSARTLAKALDISNSTVSEWTKKSRPQPAQEKQLADHFGVSVEDLMDDSKPCPQDAFSRHLSDIKSARENALAAFPNNPEAAQQAFDSILAQSGLDKERERIANALRELADSIYPQSPKSQRPALRAQLQDDLDKRVEARRRGSASEESDAKSA